MPNTIITPDVIARAALATLYNSTVLAQLVYRDYDEDFAGKQGDTITVRTPAIFEAKEFDRDAGIEVQTITEGSFPVVLDKIVDVSFEVTTEELTLEIDKFEERVMNPAMEAIVQKVDTDIAQALVAAASAGASPPFQAGGGVVELADSALARTVPIGARTRLSRKRLPATERYAVYAPEATEQLLTDDLFVRADARGDTDGLREASIGRKFGIDHFESQVLGQGADVIGAEEDPDGTKAGVAADGVAFHRTAVALVSRTLALPMGKTSEQAAIASYKGFGLRVVQDYDIDKKKDVVSLDFLYGLKATRPQGAVELDFGLAGS